MRLVFRDVRRSFKQGVVCGYVSKSDHSLHLNPGEQQTLEWGDRLIVLANDGKQKPPKAHATQTRPWHHGCCNAVCHCD